MRLILALSLLMFLAAPGGFTFFAPAGFAFAAPPSADGSFGFAPGPAQIRDLKDKAAKGDAVAEDNLGQAYVLQLDWADAAAWFQKAAVQGDADAECSIGTMHEFGRGTTQDDAQAMAWFRKAAAQGWPEAAYRLGEMYHKGEGMAADDKQAALWYRQAADEGHRLAQTALGKLYEKGKGVAQDDKEAVFWLTVSGLTGQGGDVDNTLDAASARLGVFQKLALRFRLLTWKPAPAPPP